LVQAEVANLVSLKKDLERQVGPLREKRDELEEKVRQDRERREQQLRESRAEMQEQAEAQAEELAKLTALVER
jgi:hypothetical protein